MIRVCFAFILPLAVCFGLTETASAQCSGSSWVSPSSVSQVLYSPAQQQLTSPTVANYSSTPSGSCQSAFDRTMSYSSAVAYPASSGLAQPTWRQSISTYQPVPGYQPVFQSPLPTTYPNYFSTSRVQILGIVNPFAPNGCSDGTCPLR
ncbi:MAG: hypothetical protein AAF939_09405 [Planctomycetota bacterium]